MSRSERETESVEVAVPSANGNNQRKGAETTTLRAMGSGCDTIDRALTVVGMARRNLGALLLGYFTDDGKLIYAGRVGTGMPVKVLADPQRRLDPLARKTSPLSVPPSRKTRFGSALVLSRMHWVEPKLVAEITYLTWTADNLLRHTVYVGVREDKPAKQVRREDARG